MRTTDVCRCYSIFNFLFKISFLLLLIIIYCEYLIYYFVLLGCSWPQLSKIDQDFTIQLPNDVNRKPLHVMLIADTHLLTSQSSLSFKRYRYDWQMYRSFQSAVFLFEPQIIFFLGDLTADGQTSTNSQWNQTVKHFRSLFSVNEEIRLYVIPGNHDIGFHYEVTDSNLKRFENSFQTSPVQLLTTPDDYVHFILINSMAFEGDQCRLCQKAENELNRILNRLRQTTIQTKPVLLTHFPLYRFSDANCSTSSSSYLLNSHSTFPPHKQRYHVLSQDATDHLLNNLEPRLAFSAHTHQYCHKKHRNSHGRSTFEWTVPSFTWRNRDDPSFVFLSITSNNQQVSHCYLPRQTTVYWSYAIGIFLVIFYILFGGRRPLCLFIYCFFKRTI